MSDKFSKYRPHKLCLWLPDTENDRFRETTFQDAVEIEGRWFTGQHETVDDAGVKQIAEHSAFVDRKVPTGSYLRKGALSEIDPAADPRDLAGTEPEDAHPVVDFWSVWDFDGIIQFRSVSMT